MKKEKRQSMISVRGGFSDVHGVAPSNTQVQVEEFDDKTRVLMSNHLYDILKELFNDLSMCIYTNAPRNGQLYSASSDFCKDILSNVFAQKPRLKEGRIFVWEDVYKLIDEAIEKAPYNEVLDIIWYICDWIKNNYQYHNNFMFKKMNGLFEREYVGYRFVDGLITPITDELEIQEIENASRNLFKGCRAHIHKAVGFLSDREKPDYKNSIKESISAVESICQIITGDSKATLGEALKNLQDNGIAIHPALKKSWSSLYGYTSDEGGIRHAEGLFESNVTFEEAKYMLVSCCAFVNYLIAEYGKIK